MNKLNIENLAHHDVYSSLRQSLYSIPIFGNLIDEKIHVVVADDDEQALLIEGEILWDTGTWMPSGYYFVQCLEGICDDKSVRGFELVLTKLLADRHIGPHMPIRPIIVAEGFTTSALDSLVRVFPETAARRSPRLFCLL